MARSLKQLEARLRALEEWRELMEIERGEKTGVIGFVLDHEYEDAEMPESWVSSSSKKNLEGIQKE